MITRLGINVAPLQRASRVRGGSTSYLFVNCRATPTLARAALAARGTTLAGHCATRRAQFDNVSRALPLLLENVETSRIEEGLCYWVCPSIIGFKIREI